MSIKYKLTNDDYQSLYPLSTAEAITARFPNHSHSVWTIRRRFKELGLQPINSMHKKFIESALQYRPIEISRETFEENVRSEVEEIFESRCAAIEKKISTVESRSID